MHIFESSCCVKASEMLLPGTLNLLRLRSLKSPRVWVQQKLLRAPGSRGLTSHQRLGARGLSWQLFFQCGERFDPVRCALPKIIIFILP